MAPYHPYRKLKLPRDAPFKLKPSPGQGWGGFAKRPIRKGETILSDKPLFIFQKPSLEITEEDIWIAFARLAPADRKKFLLLGDNGSGPFESGLAAMAQNTFQIHYKGSNLPACGMFPLLSRFNHSCVPNSMVPARVTESGHEALAIFAARDIAAGEEITFCYLPGFSGKTKDERSQLMPFACNCEACHRGISFQQASDMRRTLIRALQYLTKGYDEYGQESPLLFSIDPELKEAAEELCIPLSSRLVYNLLIVVLLEKEGLMDKFAVERMVPMIQKIVKRFATEENAKVAQLAMDQKTWLEKFCVAAGFYGREDAADQDVADEMRKN